MAMGGVGVSGFINAAGDIWGGFMEAKAYKMTASNYEQAAALTEQMKTIALKRQAAEAYMAQGATQAAYGGAGVRLSGSALDTLQMTARNEALDTSLMEKGYEITINNYRGEAALARQQAKSAKIKGIIKGVSDVVGAFGM